MLCQLTFPSLLGREQKDTNAERKPKVWFNTETEAQDLDSISISWLKSCIKFKAVPQVDEPEPVTQSEVSQKEKNKYRQLTHIYGI